MTTLDDIRAAGYEVTLAWTGFTEDNDTIPDVYAVSHQATQPDPTKPDYDGGMLSYLPDDPDMLEAFLHSETEATAGE